MVLGGSKTKFESAAIKHLQTRASPNMAPPSTSQSATVRTQTQKKKQHLKQFDTNTDFQDDTVTDFLLSQDSPQAA